MRSDGRPKAGCYRLMLPCDADWTGINPEAEENTKTTKKKEAA